MGKSIQLIDIADHLFKQILAELGPHRAPKGFRQGTLDHARIAERGSLAIWSELGRLAEARGLKHVASGVHYESLLAPFRFEQPIRIYPDVVNEPPLVICSCPQMLEDLQSIESEVGSVVGIFEQLEKFNAELIQVDARAFFEDIPFMDELTKDYPPRQLSLRSDYVTFTWFLRQSVATGLFVAQGPSTAV